MTTVFAGGGVIGPTPPIDIRLDIDDMAYLLETTGCDDLPGVLDSRVPYADEAKRREAYVGVLSKLTERGLIDHSGRVDGGLVSTLAVLSRSVLDLEVRTITQTPTGPTVARMCRSINARGDRVLAVRESESYSVTSVDGDDASRIVGLLGPADKFDFGGVTGPTDDVVAALSRPTAERFIALGCENSVAATLAAALRDCTVHTEIVANAHEHAITSRRGFPIAVFDTPRGRIIATSSLASDGTKWTSLAPGTAGRIRTEINAVLA